MSDPDNTPDDGAPAPAVLVLAELPQRRATRFALTPSPEARAALARELGIVAIRKLRLAGELSPRGQGDWQLTAELGATVVQPCVVTLAPVTTRLDERVERLYLARAADEVVSDEMEMPEDDRIEPLPERLDLNAVMAEALALALPLYPRAPGAEAGPMTSTAPGAAPLTDETVKPFAGLAALKDKLGPGESEE